MDGEWCGRIAESSDAAAREVVVKAALVEQRQQVLLLVLPICIRGGDRLPADLRNDSMPLMSVNCLSICACFMGRNACGEPSRRPCALRHLTLLRAQTSRSLDPFRTLLVTLGLPRSRSAGRPPPLSYVRTYVIIFDGRSKRK